MLDVDCISKCSVELIRSNAAMPGVFVKHNLHLKLMLYYTDAGSQLQHVLISGTNATSLKPTLSTYDKSSLFYDSDVVYYLLTKLNFPI